MTPNLIQIKIDGVGTQRSGFVCAEYGPFKCGNCEWFDADEAQCNNPVVGQDVALTDRSDDGLPLVDEDDCCNHFWTTGLDPAKYAKDMGLDTKSPHGFPSIGVALEKHLGKSKK